MRGKVSTIRLERHWGPVGQGLAKQPSNMDFILREMRSFEGL